MPSVSEIAPALSENERDCLLHMLGLNRGPTSYRNHFCASPGTPDDVSLTGLCGLGVVERCAEPKDNPHMPYNTYRATDFGREVAALLANTNAMNSQKGPND